MTNLTNIKPLISTVASVAVDSLSIGQNLPRDPPSDKNQCQTTAKKGYTLLLWAPPKVGH